MPLEMKNGIEKRIWLGSARIKIPAIAVEIQIPSALAILVILLTTTQKKKKQTLNSKDCSFLRATLKNKKKLKFEISDRVYPFVRHLYFYPFN